MQNTEMLSRYIPMVHWAKNYDKSWLQGDIGAGITVGIMLIPQGMAYAVLAGMPPVYGLYAALIPLLIYAVFGTSRQLAVGPVAMISLLVLAGVGSFAEPGSDRFIQLALLTAFGVGVLQVLMGIFRMGFLVNFLSHPVLSGFTSAAALIIGASQIKNLLGVPLPSTKQVHEIVYYTIQRAAEIDIITAALGAGSILLIHGLCTWRKTFPSALVVVVAGIVLTYLLGLHERGLAIVGDIPRGLPSPDFAFFNAADLTMLVPTILVIALVGYMESIAVAKAIATKRGYRVDANQELTGIGLANLGGAFFQAFPVAGGFSRTAVNDQAGARTGLASLISALIIALTVIFLTPLFYYLPLTVLAAIIIYAVASLFDIKSMKTLWKTDRRDFLLLLVTFISTLLLGIEEGIGIGVILSLIMVIYGSTRPHSAVLGRLEGTSNYRNVERYPNAITSQDVIIFRFDSALFFANASHFTEKIESLVNGSKKEIKRVILDASAINGIDSTGVHAIEALIPFLDERGIRLSMAGVIGPVRDKLKKAGVTHRLGEQHFYFDVAEAERAHRGEPVDAQRIHSPLQTF